VITCCKRADSGLDSLVGLGGVLNELLPKPGRAPWYAASAERQQFALLVLGAMGGRAAVGAINVATGGAAARPHMYGPEQAQQATAAVTAAARLLAQPPLRQLLAVAAPALLPAADAVSSLPPGSAAGLQREPLDLLRSLGWALDPLALGLALPGCYNPACTSLAGASEAGMQLKMCTGCKIAR